MPLIIGSTAFAELDDTRTPKDIDIVAYKVHILDLYRSYGGIGGVRHRSPKTATFKTINDINVEIFIADESNAWKYLLNKIGLGESTTVDIADAYMQYSIKLSHITLPKKFDKHIEDFVWLGRKIKWHDKYPIFTKLAHKEALDRADKSSLANDNKNLLDGKVDKWFHHQDIHKVMTDDDFGLNFHLPLHDDASGRWLSRLAWEAIGYEDRCKAILEEAYVIALEKRIIPFLFGDGAFFTAWESLKYAMMRLCTDSSDGWVRDFILRNYFDILCYGDMYYDAKFIQAIDDNKIKMVREKRDEKESKAKEKLRDGAKALRSPKQNIQN